ncbi:hypothetical protein ABKN59_008370 [Abortiporus biennis]
MAASSQLLESSTTKVPSASTFSFVAPYPLLASSSNLEPNSPHKAQRRVSLALPSSPRLFPAWSFRDDTTLGVTSTQPEKKGKMRRITSVEDSNDLPSTQTPHSLSMSAPPTGPIEKKQRKKWSEEETKMLVDGCNKYGVGNWKAILNDPDLKFDNRSPVDLKDRFRTYFPDAYKQHYPNAKTHLSAKVRASLPDGTSIFAKTRSKKRRPFTDEEDRALKAGYEKHGTMWAVIVKDPVFQAQNRRSTDLRDRFRNAFPDLYQAAGYKPRQNTKKKKQDGDVASPIRAATDDQLTIGRSSLGPVRSKRRHTTQGLFRGGTKSVPESTVNSDDDDTFSEDDDGEDTPASVSVTSKSQHSPEDFDATMSPSDLEMDISSMESIGELPYHDLTDSQTTWSSVDTPINSWISSSTPSHASSVLAASPTSSTDYFLPQSPATAGGNGMIGKSAWGPQDWLSPNPRLDPSGATSFGSSASSYSLGSNAFSPSSHTTSPSPFSTNHQPVSLTHMSLNHLSGHSHHSLYNSQGVVDKYDLHPHFGLDLDLDFFSEGYDTGMADTTSAFSDPLEWSNPGGMRGGFTTHSSTAGDLIFSARTHQPSGHGSMDYGPGFGFGYSSQGGTRGPNGATGGLGLEGIQSGSKSGGLHTPSLPGIDEIALTGISLDDRDIEPEPMPLDEAINIPKDNQNDITMTSSGLVGRQQETNMDSFSMPASRTLALEEIVGLPLPDGPDEGLDDDGLSMTPPETPLIGGGYRASGRASVSGMHSTTANGHVGGGHGHHNRSVSVPPSEHRSPAPRTSLSQAQTPSHQRAYKPLPTQTTIRPSFQPFQLPRSDLMMSGQQQTTIAPSQTQAQSRPMSSSHPTASSSSEAAINPSAMYPGLQTMADIVGLPFLDLHYFTGSSNADPNSNGLLHKTSDPFGQAQALDLAQTLFKNVQSKPLCVPPSFVQLVPPHGTISPLNSTRHHLHTRGQSQGSIAVSPQDLLLNKGDNNKRKRASSNAGLV